MTPKCYHPPLLYSHIIIFIYIALFKALGMNTALAQSKDIKPWSNPVLIYGSSFGNIMQQLYLTGNYEMMLKLTEKESRILYGDNAILRYYEKMQFSYPLRLVSHSQSGNKYRLIYKSKIDATVVRLKVDIIVENDTSRLVLPAGFEKQLYFLTQWK